jgi:Uma2 family endonuclease
MSAIKQLPILGQQAGFRRFSVAEYHQMIEMGMLTEDDNIEMLEGYLVKKMSRNPPHDGTLQRLSKQLLRVLPDGWDLRTQMAITLTESEPGPDAAVVRDDPDGYMKRHPGAEDVGLVVEVADSTLAGDRADKCRVYGRAGIPVYWIVNLVDRQVEVYTLPTGPSATPGYAARHDFRPGDVLSVNLDGNPVATLPVSDLLA